MRAGRRASPSRRVARRPTGGASVGPAKLAAAVLSQIALLTALLYYFGWAYAEAMYRYFGLNASAIGLSTADFVLRGAPAAFLPLVIVALAGLVASWLHLRLVVPLVDAEGSQQRLEKLGRRAVVISFSMLLLIVAGTIAGQPVAINTRVWFPVILLLSAATLLYVDHVASMVRPRLSMGVESIPRAVRGLALGALMFFGVVWALGDYASLSGARDADAFARSRDRQVVVYSAQRLAMAPPVVVKPVTQPDSKYRYQYSNLILLARAPGKLFLLPIGWRKGAGTVISIPDGDGIRMDFR